MYQMIQLCIMISKKSKTKQALLNAAIQVLSAQPSATLAEIAEAAGVKRVTLHRSFGTRDELLKAIALHSLAEMDEACYKAAAKKKTAADQLRAIVGALVPIGDRCHFLWRNASIWEEESVAAEIERHNKELSQLIDLAKKEGDIAIHIPNAWIIASLDAVIFAALCASRKGDIAVNDAAKLAEETLFQGIATRSE